jgi:hypothetical protein
MTSTFTFTLIDAARRGVILAKVKNYGQIRWRTIAGLIQWHRFISAATAV